MRQKFERGEMWLGDCLELMADIPDGSVDMILCDLPYGTTACSWDNVIPFEPLWAHYWRVAKPTAAIVLTASQPFTTALIGSQMASFRYEWIWRKNAGSNFSQTKWQPMKEHENICVFSRKSPASYYPIKQERSEAGKKIRAGKPIVSGRSPTNGVYGSANKGYDTSAVDPVMRVPSSVQNFNRERGLHPTQKPVSLFDYLIRTYTNPGELVLDNCSGSGTTAVAAHQTDRRYLCIERDVDYYFKSLDRVAAL